MIIKKLPILMLAIAALTMTTGCGTSMVRGAAPIVHMNELVNTGDNINLHLSMRNLNGVELVIQSIDFKLSVEDEELFSYKGPVETTIVANGTETWTVDVEDSQNSKLLLEQLQSGEVKSLPYALKGSIISTSDGKLQFSQQGHLYPVPGRPGHFR